MGIAGIGLLAVIIYGFLVYGFGVGQKNQYNEDLEKPRELGQSSWGDIPRNGKEPSKNDHSETIP